MKTRARTYESKIKNQKEWKRWFAWFPVMISDTESRWMEFVERRMINYCGNYAGADWDWEYRKMS